MRSQPARRWVAAVAPALLVITMAGCRTGSERAEGEAREKMRETISKLNTAARYALDGASAEQARATLDENYGEVFDSSASESGTVTWRVVILAQGSDRYSWTYSAESFRTCVKISGRDPDHVSVTNLACPAVVDDDPATARRSLHADLDLSDDFGENVNSSAPLARTPGPAIPGWRRSRGLHGRWMCLWRSAPGCGRTSER
ncbi:MAG: hypothetical protein ACR2KK_11455 [Acidimicrobiales bacterium]